MTADAPLPDLPARLTALAAMLQTRDQAVIGHDYGTLIYRRRSTRASVTVREDGTELRLDACGADPESARRALADMIRHITGGRDAP